MTTLRCTQKLLKRLGLPPALPAPPPATNALGDWYVNIVSVHRRQIVIATSELSLLTVLLPARGLRPSLGRDLLLAVEDALRAIGVPADRARGEVRAMSPIAWGNTASRSVLGSMTDMGVRLPFLLGENRTLFDARDDLNRTPMSGLAKPGDPMPYPCDVACKLLA